MTSIWMVKGSLGKGRSLKNHEFQDDDSTKGLRGAGKFTRKFDGLQALDGLDKGWKLEQLI